jgi:hypothetical protein
MPLLARQLTRRSSYDFASVDCSAYSDQKIMSPMGARKTEEAENQMLVLVLNRIRFTNEFRA